MYTVYGKYKCKMESSTQITNKMKWSKLSWRNNILWKALRRIYTPVKMRHLRCVTGLWVHLWISLEITKHSVVLCEYQSREDVERHFDVTKKGSIHNTNEYAKISTPCILLALSRFTTQNIWSPQKFYALNCWFNIKFNWNSRNT